MASGNLLASPASRTYQTPNCPLSHCDQLLDDQWGVRRRSTSAWTTCESFTRCAGIPVRFLWRMRGVSSSANSSGPMTRRRHGSGAPSNRPGERWIRLLISGARLRGAASKSPATTAISSLSAIGWPGPCRRTSTAGGRPQVEDGLQRHPHAVLYGATWSSIATPGSGCDE